MIILQLHPCIFAGPGTDSTPVIQQRYDVILRVAFGLSGHFDQHIQVDRVHEVVDIWLLSMLSMSCLAYGA